MNYFLFNGEFQCLETLKTLLEVNNYAYNVLQYAPLFTDYD